jgi:hypothetical protein
MQRFRDQLSRVTGKNVPWPDTILMHHWPEPSYFAGWHSWNIAAQSWIVAENLVQPFVGVPLFTCGEAFSSEQGWIEGCPRGERSYDPVTIWLRSH